jgi:hypothetical protein
MVVGDEVKSFMLGLKSQILPHRTKIIANMQLSRWLNTR